jgi:hypothetical protein
MIICTGTYIQNNYNECKPCFIITQSPTYLSQGPIYWKPPPPPLGEGENISQCHLGKKYEKVKRKRGKYKRKRKKGERK